MLPSKFLNGNTTILLVRATASGDLLRISNDVRPATATAPMPAAITVPLTRAAVQRRNGTPYPFIPDLVDVDRVRDVLDAALPAVREKKLGQGARLVVDALADADRSGRSQRLEPGRDIDDVSVNVALIDQDVARVDPDPHLHAVLLACLTRGKSALDVERTAYRVDRGRKLDQQSVAHAARETSVIFADGRPDQFTHMPRKARMRLVLVAAHHAAVADDIGQHDGHHSPAMRGDRLDHGRGRPRADQLDCHRGALYRFQHDLRAAEAQNNNDGA